MLVHFDLLSGNRLLFAVVHISEFCFKLLLYLLDLAANHDFVLEELKYIGTDLFADQDDDQVCGEGGHVTHPVCKHVIRDVSVDELEHVKLVD